MAFVAEERKRHRVYPPPEQVFTWTQMCDIWDVSGAAGEGGGGVVSSCAGCSDTVVGCSVP